MSPEGEEGEDDEVKLDQPRLVKNHSNRSSLQLPRPRQLLVHRTVIEGGMFK